VSERIARVTLGAMTGLVLVAVAATDLPVVSDGRFWSDGATYHAMAASLAWDGDVAFEREDLARVRALYPGGPQGVFLKRVATGGGTRLVYAKSLAYPAAAAPFVRLFGTDRGLLLTGAIAFSLALWLGCAELRRRSGPLAALAGTLAVFAAGVTPAYLFWPTPELFNLGLITAGLVAWARGRSLLSGVLLGIAAYSKPTNLLLALPLVLDPLLSRSGGAFARLVESLRRAVAVAGVAALGFGVNALATGELNYQGGERKTFYDRYPFDPGATFDSAGVWMTTDHLGPLVVGRDEEKRSERLAPPRPATELRRSFALNLGYFWGGRFGGALTYFPGAVLAALLFILVGPRRREGWLALLSLVVSWLVYITQIPDNWYGGAGTLGNRYFVNLLPLALLLVPRGREVLAAGAGALVTVALLAPILASPVHHARVPGEHALDPAFRRLPAELTMLGDLSVFTDVWRKRRPYNAPGGDVARHRPGDPPAYFLWFLDDGTWGQESSFGEEGFWLRGGETAEVVLQTLAPPARIRIRITSGPAGDIVTVRLGRERQRLVLPPLRAHEVVLLPRAPTLGYYGTGLHRLRFGSRYGAPTERDPRRLGSFVRIVLE